MSDILYITDGLRQWRQYPAASSGEASPLRQYAEILAVIREYYTDSENLKILN
ncbi:MAG: hypothetical protein FWF70_00570 [Bacteroidetes bacterium]|nr:hypothetical protein [Bacteroidota bacterium]MCL1969674.1 hypothetical protein [Bacteroidota bacterium]